MNRFAASLLLLSLLAPVATAGGLQKSRVPGGARWVVHLDVEAMRASRIYEAVHEASGRDGTNDMDEHLSEVRMFLGLDPTTDFKSVTLYCAAQSEERCVAVLAGNAKVDAALDRLKAMANYHTSAVEGRSLHTWGDEGDRWYAYVHRKDGSEERVVVASQDRAELARGIAVLEGDAESLASADQPGIRGTPASGSILFAAAGESLRELSEVEPVSAVAKLAKTIVLDVGEERGALRAHVGLDTRSAEDAQRIHQVLQGAVALVGLVGNEHEDLRSRLQPLVDSLRLSSSGTRVDVDFRYDVESLLSDLKSLHDVGERIDHGDRDVRVEKKRHVRKHRQEREDDE